MVFLIGICWHFHWRLELGFNRILSKQILNSVSRALVKCEGIKLRKFLLENIVSNIWKFNEEMEGDTKFEGIKIIEFGYDGVVLVVILNHHTPLMTKLPNNVMTFLPLHSITKDFIPSIQT